MDEAARRLAARRLAERLTLLVGTEPLGAELELVGARGGTPDTFTYQPEAAALWVVLTLSDRTWVFPFDVEALREEIGRRVVSVAEATDPDLEVALVGPSVPAPEALARRSLAPELPRVEVVVRAVDPAGIVGVQGRTATLQSVVVALAVLATGLGLLLTWRFIGQELEAARQKADFAANVSHELRSPITQIRLRAEALQLDLLDDEAERRAHYDAIVRESERLSRLVDNVLDFSAIERGVKRYHLRPEDLGDAVYKAVDAMQAAASANAFRITVDLPEDLPVVWLDREAIGQVLTNLLSNALKYGGDGGTIEVACEVLQHRVELSVRDHGIGIAPEDVDQVFEHFFRVQSAAVRKKRGTGIGLTIVRYIVEAHGGTIRVESTLGEGSTFIVSLPLEPPEDAGA
jgi:signal transduction histidine kinase